MHTHHIGRCTYQGPFEGCPWCGGGSEHGVVAWTDRTENMQAAYLAGFYASSEGYNAEYPFDQYGIEPFEDDGWCKDRDIALARLDDAHPAPAQPATEAVSDYG